MPSDNATDAQARLCRPHIVAAGLPQRDELILERERNLYALMLDRLQGRRVERETADLPPVPYADLEAALPARDGSTLPPAAWLAGRCEPEAPADRTALTALVRAVVDELPVDNLDVLAWGYSEAAFTLALRGDPDAAHQALLPLVGAAQNEMHSYLAAYYLAQLGDPSGWPVMLAALRSATAHTRLMALRHLIAFQPYEGQKVGDTTVDLRAALVARLDDHDPYVRAEVPYYLAEAQVKDTRALVEPLARDPDENVRLAAQSTLNQLSGAAAH